MVSAAAAGPQQQHRDEALASSRTKLASSTGHKRPRSINPLCRLFFCWTAPLFWRGSRAELAAEDLGETMGSDLSRPLGDELEKHWNEELIRAKHSEPHKKPRLLRALVKTFALGYTLDGVLLLVQVVCCKSFQPFVLALLIEQFQLPEEEFSQDKANLYAGLMVLMSAIWVVIQHNIVLRTQQRGMRIRIACCSLLYRKSLRLSAASLSQTTAGQLVNLMSNDVNRFDQVLLFTHFLWIMPIQVALTCYLLYRQVELSALIGVLCVLLQTTPVQIILSHLSSSLRLKIANRTDERVKLMGEIIGGIQVIKMYAWEKPFECVVSAARKREIDSITSASYIRGIYMGFLVFTERAALYVTLLAYSLMGHPISAAIVFSLAQYYNKIQEVLAFYFPSGLALGAECLVTVRRVEEFLLLEERADLPLEAPTAAAIRAEKFTKSRSVLSLAAHHNPLAETILEEEAAGGVAKPIKAETKFSSNSPDLITNYAITLEKVSASWTKESTTLSNLTLNMEKGKLYAVIGTVGSGKSSFLQLLLKELPPQEGSLKVQGEISYANQEPWLFVDTIRNNILFGQLYDQNKYKTVVRVCALEKDFQQFSKGDMSLVGERGVSLSGGQRARINLARAVYKNADIYLMDDPLSAVDTEVGRHLFDLCIKDYLSEKTRVLVTHQIHYLKAADCIIVLQDGFPEFIGSYENLLKTKKEYAQYIIAESDPAQQAKEVSKNIKRRMSSSNAMLQELESVDLDAESEVLEDSGSGKIKLKTYGKYWMAGGSACVVFSMVFTMIFGQLSATAADYWVTYWSNEQNKVSNLTEENFGFWDYVGEMRTADYLFVYTGLIVCCIIFISLRSIVFFLTCMMSSKGLHDQMFHKLLRVKMVFFDDNPSGRILNRFSKDIGAIDEMLPKAIMTMLQIFLVFCSIIVLVAVTNRWFLIPIAVILVLFYFAVNFYLASAQTIKRLETMARSPVFSHLSSTLNGITTIRAFKSQKRLINEFDLRQDSHTTAWNCYLSCSVTLGFWIDVVCVIFLAVVCYLFIWAPSGNASSGDVGLAISQTLILMGMLQFGVQQATEMFAQMTSVERVLQYTKLDEEKNLESGEIETPANWPATGEIVFSGVSLKYKDSLPPVLKELSFSIKSGWKVGIVGRTGAGKSSLISALFRLADVDGSIIIDSVDTKRIALKDIRSNISIIPQEPILFSATLRYNLDPFDKYQDAELWSALEAVDLREKLTLDYEVANGGGNLSLGQRQLICLARAILRGTKILVLDEATANVDPDTDFFIQRTIREKFARCTVLTIAHRLNTIMDSDRVLVMDAGRAAEFDHPHELLQRRDGHFARMVHETGPAMEARLIEIARTSYLEQADGGGGGERL